MMKPLGLASLLLFSTALVAPSVARAQSSLEPQGTDAGSADTDQMHLHNGAKLPSRVSPVKG